MHYISSMLTKIKSYCTILLVQASKNKIRISQFSVIKDESLKKDQLKMLELSLLRRTWGVFKIVYEVYNLVWFNCMTDLWSRLPQKHPVHILIWFRRHQFEQSTAHQKYLLHLKQHSLNLMKQNLPRPSNMSQEVVVAPETCI